MRLANRPACSSTMRIALALRLLRFLVFEYFSVFSFITILLHTYSTVLVVNKLSFACKFSIKLGILPTAIGYSTSNITIRSCLF